MSDNTRDFYDSQYHFAEDAARPDEKRIWHALSRLEPLAGQRLLDLGCGAGWAARMARARGASVIGLDFSRTALQLARKHTPEIPWVQADGTALPIADGSVTRLFCNGSLEHFPDVKLGLHEIARVLAAGGTAVLIVPNFHVRTEQPQEFRTHYWGWKKLIESADLQLLSTAADRGPSVFGAGSLKRSVVRLLGKAIGLIPFMQYQFVFTVRKP